MKKIAFELTTNQVKRFGEWQEEIEKKLKKMDKNEDGEVPNSSYSITFTQTGIGIAVYATNAATGDAIDLSEYDNW